jgi:hypothetical protein
MAAALHLELADEDVRRLLPMVQDLLAVAEKLRYEQSGRIDRVGPRDPAAHQPG